MLNVNNNDVDIGKEMTVSKNIDRDRTRTCNPQIRSLMPYPLGHTAAGYKRTTNEAYSCFTIFIVYTHLFHEFPFYKGAWQIR